MVARLSIICTLLLMATRDDWTTSGKGGDENVAQKTSLLLGVSAFEEEKTKISFTGRGYPQAKAIQKCVDLSGQKQEACWKELVAGCKAGGGPPETCNDVQKNPQKWIEEHKEYGCWEEKCNVDMTKSGHEQSAELGMACCCIMDQCKSHEKPKFGEMFQNCMKDCPRIKKCMTETGMVEAQCFFAIGVKGVCFQKMCGIDSSIDLKGQMEKVCCCGKEKCRNVLPNEYDAECTMPCRKEDEKKKKEDEKNNEDEDESSKDSNKNHGYSLSASLSSMFFCVVLLAVSFLF